MRQIAVFPLRFRGEYRSEALAAWLDTCGLPVFPVDCVDFRDPEAAQFPHDRRAERLIYGRVLSDAEFAAATSHLHAWKEAMRSEASWALILEDDVVPRASLLEWLDRLGSLSLDAPLIINLAPAWEPSLEPRASAFTELECLEPPARVFRGMLPNAQAYVVNRLALEHLSRHADLPAVTPPDFPPAVSAANFAYTKRGALFSASTVGDTTVGDRGHIPRTGRLVRWLLRLTGALYLLEKEHYPSVRSYLRYELRRRWVTANSSAASDSPASTDA